MTNENCIFCKIVTGTIPSYRVYEDEDVYGFLDIFPLKKGHMLLVPKDHYTDILETPDEISDKLFQAGKVLAKKIKNILKTPRVGFAIEGFGVDHVHLHLIPIEKGNEMNPEKTYKATEEELREVCHMYKGF